MSDSCFKFKYSYKNMFWYEVNCFGCKMTVVVSGDLYRNKMMPEYTYDEFFSEFICDIDVSVLEWNHD